MYVALSKALDAKGITNRTVAGLLGIHYNTVGLKINGGSDFELNEALIIHAAWFPEYDFTRLFERQKPDKTA